MPFLQKPGMSDYEHGRQMWDSLRPGVAYAIKEYVTRGRSFVLKEWEKGQTFHILAEEKAADGTYELHPHVKLYIKEHFKLPLRENLRLPFDF